jgi:ParB/RepB/Spo0J family partition protein
MPEIIEIAQLHPHPHNPRLDKGKETIARLAQLMKERGFDEAHAIIVRPLPRSGFQIISGHRRVQAAKRAGLATVPCWKREMTDGEAHMLLLSENIQDGLHPIEEGQHQIDSGLPQEAYAARIGVSRNTLKPKIDAARVYATIRKTVPLGEVGKRWRALAALRSAEAWLWPLWAPRLLEEGWTIEETERNVARAGHVRQPRAWGDAKALADGLLKGATRPEDLHEMNRLLDRIKDRTSREKVAQALAAAKPPSLAIAKQVVEAQTPLSLADDEAEPLAADSEPTEPLAADTELTESRWPAESSLDEPTLEQEYHGSHARHFERQAERRFRQLLKARIQPRWKFIASRRRNGSICASRLMNSLVG